MRTTLLVSLFALAGAPFMPFGCASSGYEKAGAASQRADNTRDELVAVRSALSDSVNDLEQLVAEPQPSLEPQFTRFSASVEELVDREEAMHRRARELRTRNEAYLASWWKDIDMINDPELRRRAAERADRTEADFNRVDVMLDSLAARISNLVSDLHDARRFLANDLTTSGLRSIEPMLSRAKDDQVLVQGEIDRVIAELDTLGDELTPATTASRDDD